MTLRAKLLLILLSISLIPIAILSFLSGNQLESTLNRQVTTFLDHSTKEIAGDIELQFDELIMLAEVISNLPQVQETLAKANREAAGKNPQKLLKGIKKIDKAWIKDNKNNPKALEVLSHPLSQTAAAADGISRAVMLSKKETSSHLVGFLRLLFKTCYIYRHSCLTIWLYINIFYPTKLLVI